MKIGLVTPYFLPVIGGSELYVRDLATFLHRKGHEVSILTTNVYLGRKEKLSSNDEVEGVPVRRFRVSIQSRLIARTFVSMYISTENIMREVDHMHFDVLHFHNITDFTFPVTLWNARCPTILSCHSLFEVANYHHLVGPRLYFFKKILGHMDTIHVLSQRDLIMLKRMGVKPKKLVILPPGVSTGNFFASSLREGNKLLFVGRISPEKGLETLLNAISTLDSTFELLIAGPVQDQKYLDWLQRKYPEEFKYKVKMLGPLRETELAEVYAAADLFVFPSKMESFGIVFLEAMASKLPILSTDVGIAKEFIKNGQNGFVVSIGDWKTMANKIKLLLSDGSMRHKMGENNQKLVKAQFSKEVNFSKLFEFYKNAAKVQRKP